MGDRGPHVDVLLGDPHRSLLAGGVAAGGELGLLALLEAMGVHYGTSPTLSVAPLAVAALLAGPVAVVLVDGGLLAAWGANYPVSVVVFAEGYANGFVATPSGPVVTAVYVGLLPAALWGSVGYVVATGVSRFLAGRSRSARRRGGHL